MEIGQKISTYSKESIYDFDNLIILKQYTNRILEKLKNSLQLTSLELGIGHGYSTEIFEKNLENHTVLEGDKRIIEKYKEEHPNSTIDIVETFFENYQSEKKFDFIIMGFILEHVNNPQEILTKYKNMLAKNGKIFVAVPNAEAMNRRIGHIAGLLPNLKELSENDIGLGHKRYYDVKSLTEECRKAGLIIRNIEGLFLKPLTTKQMLELKLSNEIIDAFCELGKVYPELSLGLLVELEKES